MLPSESQKELIDQLCVQMGFVRGSAQLPMYLTGENPLLIDNYPELALFRDTIFLFKAMLAPSLLVLSDVTVQPATRPRRLADSKQLVKKVRGSFVSTTISAL